jgi:hypothetical protein
MTSAGPPSEPDRPELGAEFVDYLIWDAEFLSIEDEPEIPPGYPLSDLAERCLRRFEIVVKRHASSRQNTPSSSPAIGRDPKQQSIQLSIPIEIALDLRYEKGRLEKWCVLARENDVKIYSTDSESNVPILAAFPQLPSIVASLLTLYTQLGVLMRMTGMTPGLGMQLIRHKCLQCSSYDSSREFRNQRARSRFLCLQGLVRVNTATSEQPRALKYTGPWSHLNVYNPRPFSKCRGKRESDD